MIAINTVTSITAPIDISSIDTDQNLPEAIHQARQANWLWRASLLRLAPYSNDSKIDHRSRSGNCS